MDVLSEKKKAELRAFAVACDAGLPIVVERIDPREEPDLEVMTPSGLVGIELTEIMPLPRDQSFNSPLAEASLLEDSVCLAEEIYRSDRDAVPVRVLVYPWKVERSRGKKQEMANALARFVREHQHEAKPVATFGRLDEVPEGFGVISIRANPGTWISGGSVGVTLDGIYSQLATGIAAKDPLLQKYRHNMPNAPIWLLLFSCWEVSRGVPMPHGIREWSCPSGFDRVFFFSSSSQCIEEIQKRHDT